MAHEIGVMERTRLRLAAVSDEDLQKVLARVLPNLLKVLTREDIAVRTACLSTLSHINSRIRAVPTVLPVASLMKLYRTTLHENALAGSTALVYIDKGLAFMNKSERLVQLDELLLNVSSRIVAHQAVIAKIFLSCLSDVSYSPNPDDNTNLFVTLIHTKDRQWILDVSLRALMLTPTSSLTQSETSSVLNIMQNAVHDRSIESLRVLKLLVLKLLLCGAFTMNETHRHELVARSDSHHEVVAQGEMLPRRLGAVDREDSCVVDALINLYTFVNVSFSVKESTLLSLAKSNLAPQKYFIDIVKIIFSSCFVPTNNRIVHAGLILLIKTLKESLPENIHKISLPLLKSLLKSLHSFSAKSVNSNVDSSTIRCFLYDAIAGLCSISPHLLANGIELPQYFFKRLEVEFITVQHSLKSAVSVLAGIYVKRVSDRLVDNDSLPDVIIENLIEFLLSLSEVECSLVRLSILQWINRICAFNHHQARLLCIHLSTDSAGEVKEEARRGLIARVHERRPELLSFPRFPSFLKFLHENLASIDFDACMYEQAILFLRKCFVASAKESNESLHVYSLRLLNSELSLYENIIFHSFETFCNLDIAKDLHASASRSLLQLVDSRLDIYTQKMCSTRLQLIENQLLHGSESTREDFAKLLTKISDGLSQEQVFSLLEKFKITLPSNVKYDDTSRSGALLGIGSCFRRLAHYDNAQARICAESLLDFLNHRSPLLQSAACVSLSVCAQCLSLAKLLSTNAIESTKYSRLVKSLVKLARGTTENRCSENAIICLGKIALNDRDSLSIERIMGAIESLGNLRDEQLLFALGESVTMLASGVDITVLMEGNKTTLIDNDIMEKIVQRIRSKLIVEGSVVMRCSGAVWLLSLVKYCGNHSIVTSKITQFQDSFSMLLLDSRVLTQECASKGLAYLFELCAPHQRPELLKSLVSTFAQGITSNRSDETDTQTGFASYKELCMAAKDLGRADLVYRFMDLASHHSVWRSHRGSAFSLRSLYQTSEILLPHLNQIIAKLYRYQYDPNLKIRNTMKMLWKSLIPESIKVINDNFAVIMCELVSNLIAKSSWRVRESCCVALCDLLSGRKLELIKEFLSLIYTNLFLVLDDMQESVRAAALVLAKSVVSITERICDISHSSEDTARSALNIVLPILLDSGIHSKCKEVAAISTQTLVHITKASGHLIQPHLKNLVRVLLEALSSVENTMLQYAMFHTGSLNVTTERLESIRLMMAKTSPIGSALAHCAEQVETHSAEGVVRSVEKVIRQGTGLPTLDGAAKFVVNMSATLGKDMAQYSSSLVSAFSSGLLDSSPSLRKAFASALAHICKTASQKTISRLLTKITQMFIEMDEDIAAEIAGFVTMELAYRAHDQLKPCFDQILPLAFVASHDTRSESRKHWANAWQECTAGPQTGIREYKLLILDIVDTLLLSKSYQLRVIAIESLADMAKALEKSFIEYLPRVLPQLLLLSRGPFWQGKTFVFKCLTTICVSTSSVISKNSAREILTAIQESCTLKSDVAYTTIPLRCYGRTAELFPAINTIDDISLTLKNIITQPESNFVSHSDEHEGGAVEHKRCVNKLLVTAFDCIRLVFPRPMNEKVASKALQHELEELQKTHLSWTIACINSGIIGRDFVVRVAALHALQILISAHVYPQTLFNQDNFTTILQRLFECLKDSKHSAVRAGAMKVFVALLRRKEILSCLTPFAERIREALFALAGDLTVDVRTSVDEAKILMQRFSQH